MKNKYKIIAFIISCIICLIVISLNLLSLENIREIYLEQTKDVIIDGKKDFLKDTVNNIFLEMDRLRETKYANYKRNTEVRLKRFQEELDLSDEKFIEFFKNRFIDDMNSQMWTAFLWDDDTGEVLYDSDDLYLKSIDGTVENLKSLISYYAEIEKGSIRGIFGVSKSYIDEVVKTEIGDVIRGRKFSNDAYMWVNEVINYEGGKNYAIRRIHPNLRETEGNYLSTDTTDIRGNLPYLEELEGIKENGEIFFNYFFKELNSSQISEKMTYAKHYKDYDWIISMGVYLNDIDVYTEKTNKEIDSLSNEMTMRLIIYILVVFLIGFTILYVVSKTSLLDSTKSLEKEINLDTLTKASSRRCGDNKLANLFKRYKITGENPAIMMFDIDGFKHINDKYGHQAGDIVLIEVVKTIKGFIRISDELIRWGGDEFVVILSGLREDNIADFGSKLLGKISLLKIPVEDEIIGVTISVGFSYFKDSDNNHNDVLQRADDAMYTSKEQGKNRVNVFM